MILFVGQIGTGMRDREAFQEVDYRAVSGTLSAVAVAFGVGLAAVPVAAPAQQAMPQRPPPGPSLGDLTRFNPSIVRLDVRVPSDATSASCAASPRSAWRPPTTSARYWRCARTASCTTRCGRRSTSSCASSEPA